MSSVGAAPRAAAPISNAPAEASRRNGARSRGPEGANAGLALIRDGNATRSFETLLRYRGAAMAEFWRALKTLKALQAERAAGAPGPLRVPLRQSRAPARVASRPAPNEPERRPLHDYVIPDQAGPGRTLHEPAAALAAKRTLSCGNVA